MLATVQVVTSMLLLYSESFKTLYDFSPARNATETVP